MADADWLRAQDLVTKLSARHRHIDYSPAQFMEIAEMNANLGFTERAWTMIDEVNTSNWEPRRTTARHRPHGRAAAAAPPLINKPSYLKRQAISPNNQPQPQRAPNDSWARLTVMARPRGSTAVPAKPPPQVTQETNLETLVSAIANKDARLNFSRFSIHEGGGV